MSEYIKLSWRNKFTIMRSEWLTIHPPHKAIYLIRWPSHPIIERLTFRIGYPPTNFLHTTINKWENWKLPINSETATSAPLQVLFREFSEMLRTVICRIPEAALKVFGFYFEYLNILAIHFHLSQ